MKLYLPSINVKKLNTSLCLCLGLCLPISAQSQAPSEPTLALKQIMQQLSKKMQSASDAIAREDWEMVVKLAPQIGQHEEPPTSEKLRILAHLGKNAAQFRHFDHQTHQAADEMQAAARKQDGKAVINAYAKIQMNCLACHSTFRSGFQQHFYAAPLQTIAQPNAATTTEK